MWAAVIVFDALQSNKTAKLELSADNGVTTLREALSNANTREMFPFEVSTQTSLDMELKSM